MESADWSSVKSALGQVNVQESRRRTSIEIWDNVKSMPSTQELVREIRTASKDYDQEIDRSVAGWSLGDRLPKCTRMVNTWRFERIRCADLLMIYMAPRELSHSPYSWREGVSVESAIKWLLTDWWYERGVVFYATWQNATWNPPELRYDPIIKKNSRSRCQRPPEL
jgi:uncharacterized protein (DUF2235 family)